MKVAAEMRAAPVEDEAGKQQSGDAAKKKSDPNASKKATDVVAPGPTAQKAWRKRDESHKKSISNRVVDWSKVYPTWHRREIEIG
ncbi:unnamed protein product [Cuscuta epithymum]|uniref:Uncharacterized protein n=1 Tax=Cuscuta epithymum TaxID=186058 RepID=A0AAV0DSP0_9ASTE|nr:unnamed protein product [Cuscuta epithymum]